MANGMSTSNYDTRAEELIDIAEAILKARCVLIADWVDEAYTARAKFALDFYRANKTLQLRAVFEGWSLDRIARELRV